MTFTLNQLLVSILSCWEGANERKDWTVFEHRYYAGQCETLARLLYANINGPIEEAGIKLRSKFDRIIDDVIDSVISSEEGADILEGFLVLED